MLEPENLHRLILKEQWTDILRLRYAHKRDILSDAMWQHAATTFESTFFKSVKDYPILRKDIEESLDTLYVLNDGKFYKLSGNNYKILILEIVKRKLLKEAVHREMKTQ